MGTRYIYSMYEDYQNIKILYQRISIINLINCIETQQLYLIMYNIFLIKNSFK